jgi:hypothetical protein
MLEEGRGGRRKRGGRRRGRGRRKRADEGQRHVVEHTGLPIPQEWSEQNVGDKRGLEPESAESAEFGDSASGDF